MTRVLDLFAGLRGWSRPWDEIGADVTTLDLGVDGDFPVDFRLDVLEVRDLADLERGRGAFDVVLASPPCTAFSVAAMGKNWERNERTGGILGPKHPRAELGMRIAEHTFRLVDRYVDRQGYGRRGPRVRYVVENPIGALRVMPFAFGRADRRSTWYCRWGETRAKPTDLWTNLGGELPMCRAGDPDHERSPRGARTGTQGLATAAARSLVPYALARAVRDAALGDGEIRALPSAELRLIS